MVSSPIVDWIESVHRRAGSEAREAYTKLERGDLPGAERLFRSALAARQLYLREKRLGRLAIRPIGAVVNIFIIFEIIIRLAGPLPIPKVPVAGIITRLLK